MRDEETFHKNLYTMKSCASVLANKLMKYADIKVARRVPRRNLSTGGSGSLPSMPLAHTRGQERYCRILF